MARAFLKWARVVLSHQINRFLSFLKHAVGTSLTLMKINPKKKSLITLLKRT